VVEKTAAQLFTLLTTSPPPVYWRPALIEWAAAMNLIVTRKGDFYDLIFPPQSVSRDYMIRIEGWGEGCLEEGFGSCSIPRHGEEAEWPAGTLRDRLQQYKEEAQTRRKELAGTFDPDAPPMGARLIKEAWMPIPGGEDSRHEVVQVSLWAYS
jgi:hypothetical protein